MPGWIILYCFAAVVSTIGLLAGTWDFVETKGKISQKTAARITLLTPLWAPLAPLLVAVVFLLTLGLLLGLAGEGIGKLILMAFPPKEKAKGK